KAQVYVSGRWDMTKEMTNSQTTDTYREDVFGDVWLQLGTKIPLHSISKGTAVAAGLRTLLSVSEESQAHGYYVQAGATAGAEQKIPLRGESAAGLNEFTFPLSGWYNPPFPQATTPVAGFFGSPRQDSDGRSFISDQVRGSTLVNHSLMASGGAKLAL